MKQKQSTFLFLAICIMLSVSCSKQELLQPDPPKVVQLTINGNTTVDLEYLYQDNVVASTKAGTGNINVKTLLSVKDQNAEIEVRKKGSTQVVLRKAITAMPFDQNISIFYDGIKVYDSTASLLIKGYILSGDLEFLLDGTVLLSGTGIIDKLASIPIDKGTTRKIEVRKKGETTILLTKIIESNVNKQNLGFFFDGTKIIDNVQLDPPANPANMRISAKFETVFIPQFTGKDIDVVFYVKNNITGAASKPNPEIRLTLPANGTFNTIDLPPLPNASYTYSFDIFEKGTTKVPYTTTSAPFVLAAFPYKPNEGQYGSLNFEAGKSKLFIMKDTKKVVTAPVRATYFTGEITDLSQYFQ